MDKYLVGSKKIVSENIYMTISTSSKSGKPWISPVFFVYDKNYNLYWVSNKNARHSKLVKSNSQVAIAIFNSSATEGQGDGVYFEAKVIELKKKEEIEEAMTLFNKRVTQDEFKIKNISEVEKKGVWRIYKAIPYKFSKLTEGEMIDGQYIDKRIDIDLKELQKI